MQLASLKTKSQAFPGGSLVKNPPANAGDTGSVPGLGRSHMPQSNEASMPQLLSPGPGAQELQLLSPCVLEPVLCNKRSHQMRNLSTATRENPEQQQRPCTAKNKFFFLNPSCFSKKKKRGGTVTWSCQQASRDSCFNIFARLALKSLISVLFILSSSL